MPLPANSYCDGPQVSRDVVVFAVQVAEFGVELDVGANLAGDAATKVVAELVLAGVEEVAVDRQTAVEAVSPPGEESVARRTWNRGRGVEFARTMHERRTEYQVTTPILGHGNVNDRIKHQRVPVSGCARGLGQLQRRSTQRQVIELKVEAKPEILAVIAGDSRRGDTTSAAHISIRSAVGETRSAANVEAPFLIVEWLFSRPGRLFGRSFLAARLIRLLLGLRLRRGWLLRGRLLGVDDCDSHRNGHYNCKKAESGNRGELSNHSFSSRCRPAGASAPTYR